MLKKNINITNVFGQQEVKECHFNLTRMEVYDLQKKYKEGYENHVKSAMDSKNADSMLNVFTELVLSSYCEVDANGAVLKSEEIKNRFQHSEEYSELMFELLDAKDTTKAEAFFKAIMPRQMLDALNTATPNQKQQNQPNQNNQNSNIVNMPNK